MPNSDDSQRLPNTVLSAWQHTTDTATRMLVLPDGCRDFIIRSNPQGFSLHMLSPLDDSARYVESDRGDRYFGWRLHPAASFNQAHARSTKLTERLNELTTQFPIDPQHHTAQILQVLDDLFDLDTQIGDALASLKTRQSVPHSARELGVSERSLQRWLIQKTGRSPTYWRNLARARQAAQALLARMKLNSDKGHRINLAELAADFAYADQAHLCREFQRWFGCSPSTMLRSPIYQKLIMADGYA